MQTKTKEDVQYYSYSNKDYWAFVSANEKTQLQKEGKLPANLDHDDVPGGDFESSVYYSDEDQPRKKVDLVSKATNPGTGSPAPLKSPQSAPAAPAKKGGQQSCLGKRASKQVEKADCAQKR